MEGRREAAPTRFNGMRVAGVAGVAGVCACAGAEGGGECLGEGDLGAEWTRVTEGYGAVEGGGGGRNGGVRGDDGRGGRVPHRGSAGGRIHRYGDAHGIFCGEHARERDAGNGGSGTRSCGHVVQDGRGGDRDGEDYRGGRGPGGGSECGGAAAR